MSHLDDVEAAIWYQARHLVSDDPLCRSTAMEAIRAAVRGYAEDMAGPIVRRRRAGLRSDLEQRPPSAAWNRIIDPPAESRSSA